MCKSHHFAHILLFAQILLGTSQRKFDLSYAHFLRKSSGTSINDSLKFDFFFEILKILKKNHYEIRFSTEDLIDKDGHI